MERLHAGTMPHACPAKQPSLCALCPVCKEVEAPKGRAQCPAHFDRHVGFGASSVVSKAPRDKHAPRRPKDGLSAARVPFRVVQLCDDANALADGLRELAPYARHPRDALLLAAAIGRDCGDRPRPLGRLLQGQGVTCARCGRSPARLRSGLLLGANAGFLALALFAASRREDDR